MGVVMNAGVCLGVKVGANVIEDDEELEAGGRECGRKKQRGKMKSIIMIMARTAYLF